MKSNSTTHPLCLPTEAKSAIYFHLGIGTCAKSHRLQLTSSPWQAVAPGRTGAAASRAATCPRCSRGGTRRWCRNIRGSPPRSAKRSRPCLACGFVQRNGSRIHFAFIFLAHQLETAFSEIFGSACSFLCRDGCSQVVGLPNATSPVERPHASPGTHRSATRCRAP